MRKDWWVPLTGIGFILVAIIAFLVGGEPPEADSPVQEVVDFYVDDKDSIQAGALLIGIAAALLVFFAGHLRSVLAAAEGPNGRLSAVAFAGAVILAAGAAIDGTISFALAEAADDIEPSAVQALQALWDNDWLPLALGTCLFLLASGLSIVRHGALPQWLGYIAIVLGVISLTPIGFVGFLGGAVWIAVTSVLMTLALRSERDDGRGAPVAPAPPPM